MTMHKTTTTHGVTTDATTAGGTATSAATRHDTARDATAAHGFKDRAGTFARQLVRFARLQARCCAFAVALLGGMAVSRLLPPLPVARYDLLLAYGVLLTAAGFLLGWETRREVAVIAACHLLGLAFEMVKVRVGSWSYPEPGLARLAGVPLYGGFMYAAVGSYVCRAWRLLDLTFTGYRARATAALAVCLYGNFLSHHWLPDLRLPLGALLLAATTGTWVHYTIVERRHRMPLAVAFALIGFFLWLAENIATYLGAWRYPYQLHGWEPVSVSKWVSWALLISVTFVICGTGRWRGGALPPGQRRDEPAPDDQAVPGGVLGRASGEGEVAAGGVVAVEGLGEGTGHGPDDSRVAG
ncbi:uncharacterized membrane protein YoaT (DUF817 family) [Streptomyces rishiriensis]|uniref:Uncharacterized membrane protein YoaT (DUF817 family) n=1 Tax=Streptomyces rishiriensis TaxID=68264 RepID=A0ABU0NR65_STRRH|nr:uncharacterized membrane protein YoaT (DUF817 family) [Streptomyces rishiriensis]